MTLCTLQLAKDRGGLAVPYARYYFVASQFQHLGNWGNRCQWPHQVPTDSGRFLPVSSISLRGRFYTSNANSPHNNFTEYSVEVHRSILKIRESAPPYPYGGINIIMNFLNLKIFTLGKQWAFNICPSCSAVLYLNLAQTYNRSSPSLEHNFIHFCSLGTLFRVKV